MLRENGELSLMQRSEVPHQEPAVPIPAAYTRHLSYDLTKQQYYHKPGTNGIEDRKLNAVQSDADEIDSLKDSGQDEKGSPLGKIQLSLLIFLRGSRIWIRVLAILIMIVSFSLILTAVIMFAKAQKHPGHPLDSVPKAAPITDQPCIVFTGIAAMNLAISVAVLSLSCISSRVCPCPFPPPSPWFLLAMKVLRLTVWCHAVQEKQQCFQCRLCYH